jgi:hypothetical protein
MMSDTSIEEERMKTPKPSTVGEELFLVHLQRKTGDTMAAEEHEEHLRKRDCPSVGEELWDVYRKRSRGTEEEEDDETEEAHAGEDDCPSSSDANASGLPKKHAGDFSEKNGHSGNQKCRYNLRSSDSSKKV